MRIVDLCGARAALGLGLEITRLGRFWTGADCRRVRVRVRELGGGGDVKVERS